MKLAALINWQQSDVSKVERGVRRLDVLELRTWLSALGQPVGAFAEELDRRLCAQTALASGWTPAKARRGLKA